MKILDKKCLHVLHALHGVMVLILICVFPSTAAAQRQVPPINPSTAIVYGRWTDAVMQHVPGEADDALMAIEAFTPEDRQQLNAGLNMFRDALLKKSVRASNAAQKRIADLGAAMALTPGFGVFVERALLLHGDAAIVALQDPEVAPAGASAALVPPRAGAPALPRQVLERDGEVVGVTSPNWNWSFTRALVAFQPPKAGTPLYAFVADWFHATTAFLMSRRQFGEAQTHLRVGALVAGKDARVLFDYGTFFEMQGMPISQSLLSSEDVAAMRPGSRLSLATRSLATQITGVRPVEAENEDAIRRYRWALDIDPDLAEARVRLARILLVRGDEDGAAKELSKALASLATAKVKDPVVEFYAQLFAARADRAMGKLESAGTHYDLALRLFPFAQSALLGASQVAVLRADVSGALAFTRKLESSAAPSDQRADPWWVYEVGTGRRGDALMRELWAKARQR